MKILFIATSFYSQDRIKGGMAKYLYNLILRLKSKHKISLLIPSDYNISIPDVSIYHYYKSDVLLVSWLLSFVSIILSFFRILVKERPEIISNFLPNMATAFIFPLGKLLRIKTIMNFRGFSESNSKSETIGVRICNNISYFFTDAIITNSPHLIRKFREVVAIGKNKYDSLNKVFIPNAIDPEFWYKQDLPVAPQFDISFVGNLYNSTRIRIKGFKFLCAALHIIQKRHQKKLLVNVIGAYSIEAIRNEIKDFDESFFHFSGSLLRLQDVRDQIQNSQIFVLSSISEGMPNALMEAMCSGIPSIATNVGGVSKLISDYGNGFIVQPSNSEELADSIWHLLQDQELQQKFSKLGRKTMIEKFSWEVNVKLVEWAYSNIASKKTE